MGDTNYTKAQVEQAKRELQNTQDVQREMAADEDKKQQERAVRLQQEIDLKAKNYGLK